MCLWMRAYVCVFLAACVCRDVYVCVTVDACVSMHGTVDVCCMHVDVYICAGIDCVHEWICVCMNGYVCA